MTLDDDLLRRLKELARRRREPLKVVVNEVIRAGLRSLSGHTERRSKVRPHHCGFRPGVDPDRLNRLSDQLESELFDPRDS